MYILTINEYVLLLYNNTCVPQIMIIGCFGSWLLQVTYILAFYAIFDLFSLGKIATTQFWCATFFPCV